MARPTSRPTASRVAATSIAMCSISGWLRSAIVFVGLVRRRHVHIELQDAETALHHLPRAPPIGGRRQVIFARGVPAVMFQADFALPLLFAFAAHPFRIARHQQRRDAFERIAGMAIGIDCDRVAILAAQDLPDGNLVPFADRIQQRRLDAVDGVEDQARGGVDHARAHAPHDAVDRNRILADQDRR